jgi:DNA repair protein RadC
VRDVGGCARLLTAPAANYLTIARAHPDAAILLRTVSELVRRSLTPRAETRTTLTNWHALLHFLRMEIAHLVEERAIVLYFNSSNTLVSKREFYGTVNRCRLHVRDVVKSALDLSATAVILAHNHPGGCAAPSRADIELTREIAAALEYLDIALHDSVIVTSNNILSFRSEGLLLGHGAT